MKKPPDITVTSGVSDMTGNGFVIYRWGELAAQMTPAEAKLHAIGLIEAADAALFDAALIRALNPVPEKPDNVTLDIIRMIRLARGADPGSHRLQFHVEPLE